MKTLREWLGLCTHQWKVLHEVNVYGENGYGKQTALPIRTDYHLQCTKCGDIKKRRA